MPGAPSFARVRNEAKLDRIALGHTRSDQAETVLYRFLRGSGSAGLAAMRPVSRDGLIRPLLAVSREEVRAWAQSQGISWREDSSNQDPRFARNVLRNEAIPALARNFNPNLEGVLAGTALVAQAEEDYWEGLVAATYAQLRERSHLGSFFQVEGSMNCIPRCAAACCGAPSRKSGATCAASMCNISKR